LAVHHGPAPARVSLPSDFHLFASPASGFVRDWCSQLRVAGGAFQVLVLSPVSLLFYFPLDFPLDFPLGFPFGSEGILVRLSETAPLSTVPRDQGVGMREVHPKNLGIARGSYTSTQ